MKYEAYAAYLCSEVPLSMSACHLQDDTSDHSSDAGCTIQHLPPVLMHIDMPSNYPSEQPPIVQLSAPWLTHEQVQQLHQHLSQLWDEAPGQMPICYTWIDWLQQDSLDHMGLSDAINLSAFAPELSAATQQTAPTASSSNHDHSSADTHSLKAGHDQTQSPEEVLVTLLQFDVAEKQHAFREGTWPCGICFDQVPGRQCVQASLKCGHVYCQDCMRQHCALHVKEGSLEHLRCPQPDCKEALDRQVHLGCTVNLSWI